MIYRVWIGKRLQHYRAESKLTQLQVAHELDMFEATYQAYEQGRAEPSVLTLFKVCKLFGINIETLLKDPPQ